MSAEVVQAVLDQYLVDAPFLWVLRDQASRSPDRRTVDVANLDTRLDAALDGLRIAGSAGRKSALEEAERFAEGGEAFIASVLVLEAGSAAEFTTLAKAIGTDPDARRGMLSAMAWVGMPHLQDLVRKLATSEDPNLRTLAVGAYSVYRANPGDWMDRFLKDEPPVRARALRLIGELGRTDLAAAASGALSDDDPECGLWAAWSAVRLGDRDAALTRLSAAAGPTRDGWRAFLGCMAAMEDNQARDWLRDRWPDDARILIAGAGLIGFPGYLPWLVEQAHDPDLALLAGEAISMITGRDIEEDDLSVTPDEPPSDGELDIDALPDDPTPDPGTADAFFAEWSRDLPQPDPEKLQAWLGHGSAGLTPDQRFIAGRPVNPGELARLDREATQRVRRWAALLAGFETPAATLRNCAVRPVPRRPRPVRETAQTSTG